MEQKTLVGRKCKSKKSNIIWEIWAIDSEEVAIMSYSSTRTSSKRISVTSFEKNWIII